jgi:cyclohexanecarboxylate-CoA ligase
VTTLDDLLTGVGDHPTLLVDGERRLSSPDVHDLVARIAGGLASRGVGRGDVVAWQMPNRIEGVLLFRACWRLGAVAAPVHHLAGESDVAAMLGQVPPRLVVTEADLDALGRGEPVTDPHAEPNDLAAVIFTSGSAGTPKAVLHTHRTLAAKATAMRDVHGLTSDDAVLMPAPLAHVSGLLNGVLVPGTVPFTTVLMAKWDPDEAVHLVEAERVTFMVGPPTFFVGLMESPQFTPERVASLRLVSSGGSGVTPAFVERAARTLGARVKRTYGSSEAPTVATSYQGDDPGRASTTDGRATPGTELRVVDPVSGEGRAAGEAGELWVRGPEVFVGYADGEATREAFADGGWFRTGDLATLDADGWLTIVGRLKDVIIRGGENIAAAEVEAVLEAHPVVSQAVAVGEPDERLGERVAAFVVADGAFDLDACRAWFDEQGVAKFKTPERVVVVDALPLLPAGKPDRAALRARLT